MYAYYNTCGYYPTPRRCTQLLTSCHTPYIRKAPVGLKQGLTKGDFVASEAGLRFACATTRARAGFDSYESASKSIHILLYHIALHVVESCVNRRN